MGFERCHPAVNLIYFAAVIAGTVMFQHPVFLMLSFLCACSYSIRRNRGRAFVIALFTFLTMTFMAMILGFTDMTYDPRVIWKPIQPLTILFYAGYTILCLMPLGLELWTEYQFTKAREAL